MLGFRKGLDIQQNSGVTHMDSLAAIGGEVHRIRGVRQADRSFYDDQPKVWMEQCWSAANTADHDHVFRHSCCCCSSTGLIPIACIYRARIIKQKSNTQYHICNLLFFPCPPSPPELPAGVRSSVRLRRASRWVSPGPGVGFNRWPSWAWSLARTSHGFGSDDPGDQRFLRMRGSI